MGDINLVVYIKHEIDNIMKNVRIWVQAYVDNIICNTKSVFDLFKKLNIFFNIFFEYNISIKPIKSFFNYSDVGLLGQ